MLGLPRLSLAHLLSHYCSLQPDKQFQLADWRIRPLPAEMVHYARQDTRYLIYVYTKMKNELISQGNANTNLLRAVLRQSNDICRKRFYKPQVGPDSHMEMTTMMMIIPAMIIMTMTLSMTTTTMMKIMLTMTTTITIIKMMIIMTMMMKMTTTMMMMTMTTMMTMTMTMMLLKMLLLMMMMMMMDGDDGGLMLEGVCCC